MAERGQLTEAQVFQLLQAVKPGRVKIRDGHSHMEGYDVRAHLTRIFGFEGWDIEGPPAECIHDVTLDTGRKKDNGWPFLRYSCAYRQHLTLVVYDAAGLLVKRVIGQAVGKAENQPSFGDAHDLALKDAETQALKRAAMNLGDQFGLGLYNKTARLPGGSYKAAVKTTLVRPPGAGEDMETPEVGDELDDVSRPREVEAPGPIAGTPPRVMREAAAREESSGGSHSPQWGPEHPDHPMYERPVANGEVDLPRILDPATNIDRTVTEAAFKNKLLEIVPAPQLRATLAGLKVPSWPITAAEANELFVKVKRARGGSVSTPAKAAPKKAPAKKAADEPPPAPVIDRALRAGIIGRLEVLGEDMGIAFGQAIDDAGGVGGAWRHQIEASPASWDAWLSTLVQEYEDAAAQEVPGAPAGAAAQVSEAAMEGDRPPGEPGPDATPEAWAEYEKSGEPF